MQSFLEDASKAWLVFPGGSPRSRRSLGVHLLRLLPEAWKATPGLELSILPRCRPKDRLLVLLVMRITVAPLRVQFTSKFHSWDAVNLCSDKCLLREISIIQIAPLALFSIQSFIRQKSLSGSLSQSTDWVAHLHWFSPLLLRLWNCLLFVHRPVLLASVCCKFNGQFP